MLTLSYGYLKPQTGDKGGVFFPALAFDIQRLNDHTHDGANSAKLTAAAATALTASIPAGSWVLQSASVYRQTLSLPSGLLFDTTQISTRDSAGKLTNLEVEKLTATTFYVYTNDNSKTYTAVYTT